MMNQVSAAKFIFGILIIMLIGSLLLRVGAANPYIMDLELNQYLGVVSPRLDTISPQVSILSPRNNTAYHSQTVWLAFNVSGPSGPKVSYSFIASVYYRADWLDQDVFVLDFPPFSRSGLLTFSGSVILAEVPDGEHSLVVNVKYLGQYLDTEKGTVALFHITGSLEVVFWVDTASPGVSILRLQNQSFECGDVPLDVSVNRAFSRVAYSLDGRDNVTFSGNTVLVGLGEGEHAVVVYAWDEAGNVGVSEPNFFNVASEPFPATLVMVAFVVAAVVGAGLLLYFKKRRKQPLEKLG